MNVLNSRIFSSLSLKTSLIFTTQNSCIKSIIYTLQVADCWNVVTLRGNRLPVKQRVRCPAELVRLPKPFSFASLTTLSHVPIATVASPAKLTGDDKGSFGRGGLGMGITG